MAQTIWMIFIIPVKAQEYCNVKTYVRLSYTFVTLDVDGCFVTRV